MISAVVINWNGRHYLKACLDSIVAQDPPPDEIILVDNHSEDGSREFVAKEFPQVRIVDTGSNVGPAKARNIGVSHASHDLVLCIDNDVVMQSEALAHMQRCLAAHADTAVVQARSVCADRPDVLHYDGSDVHFLGLLVLHHWFQPLSQATKLDHPIGGLVALCFLVHKKDYLQLAGFNDALFILFEDTDFALRLRMHGRQIRLCTDAVVQHGGGTAHLSMRQKSDPYPARRVFLHSRNRWLVLLTCLQAQSLFVLLPAQLCYELLQLCFATAKGHPLAWLKGKWALLRLLPKVRTWRRAAQQGRCADDRDLLVGGPLTLNPGLAASGAKGFLHRCLNGFFAGYWRLLGRFCD